MKTSIKRIGCFKKSEDPAKIPYRYRPKKETFWCKCRAVLKFAQKWHNNKDWHSKCDDTVAEDRFKITETSVILNLSTAILAESLVS